MTEAALVSLVLSLCVGPYEQRVTCAENLVNCAVKLDGTVMTKQDFTEICVKEQLKRQGGSRGK